MRNLTQDGKNQGIFFQNNALFSNFWKFLKNILGQKWQPVITNYRCPKQNLVDTGATITLNKIRKANQK